MTLFSSSSLKKALFNRSKKKQANEDLDCIEDAFSATVENKDSLDTLDDEVVVDEEPNVEYSLVLVENHLDDQPVETELVLTTTTTYEKNPTEEELLLLQGENEAEEEEGFIAQCTLVQCPLDDASVQPFDEREVVLNTHDVSHCTSVLIERQGNRPTEIEMVLTTARIKPIHAGEQDQEQQEEEEEEEDMPEVIPPSEDDLIVVLTDDIKDMGEEIKEEHQLDDIKVEAKEEPTRKEPVTPRETIVRTLLSFPNTATANNHKDKTLKEDSSNAPPRDIVDHEDNVSVSLLSFHIHLENSKHAHLEEHDASMDPQESTGQLIAQGQYVPQDSIDHADNVSVSLQSYENSIANINDKPVPTATKFYTPGKSARRPQRPQPQPHQDEATARARFFSQLVMEEYKEVDGSDSTRPIVDATTQRALLAAENEMQYDQKPSLLSLTALQNDLWIKLLNHGSSPVVLQAETNDCTDDDDDASLATQTLEQTTVGSELTDATSAHHTYVIDPLALLYNNAAAAVPVLDHQQLEMLAELLDPTQLGHLVANNYWLQRKAETAGIPKNDFQEIMSDLLFL